MRARQARSPARSLVAVRTAVLTALFAVLITGCATAAETGSSQWDLVREHDAELTIRVYVGSSSCNSLGPIDVSESREQVGIVATVFARHPSSGEDCTQDLRLEEVQVKLGSPLGDRHLVGCRPAQSIVPAQSEPLIEDCRETEA